MPMKYSKIHKDAVIMIKLDQPVLLYLIETSKFHNRHIPDPMGASHLDLNNIKEDSLTWNKCFDKCNNKCVNHKSNNVVVCMNKVQNNIKINNPISIFKTMNMKLSTIWMGLVVCEQLLSDAHEDYLLYLNQYLQIYLPVHFSCY
jgi:hypothetical protein